MQEKKADRIVWEQEARRDLSQTIVVVDCDAFYASVEELDDPSLKGRAFGVGEGVLTTASYEARKYGCVSSQHLAQNYRMTIYAISDLQCPDILPKSFVLSLSSSSRTLRNIRQLRAKSWLF